MYLNKAYWHTTIILLHTTLHYIDTAADLRSRPQTLNTLKCLSIGTPKAINFPFVSNEKLMIFRCPSIQAHYNEAVIYYNEAVIYLNFGTPKNNEFSIWNKMENLLFLGVPILKHIRVSYIYSICSIRAKFCFKSLFSFGSDTGRGICACSSNFFL